MTRLDKIALLREALAGLVDDDPCRIDHNGNCQTHFITNPCEMAFAHEVLRATDDKGDAA